MIFNELCTSSRSDYQRDNFDKFLKKINFSFTLPSIHVAGTNGKGTTCNYLASIYQAMGYKVGLYTSPYFYNINELIKINGNEINDEDLVRIYSEFARDITKFNLSEYEIETLIAFTYFKEQKCDICIIECCMGGLYDATNIFVPSLSIITSISLEHTNYLGTSLSEIAINKAGIIKDDIPVLIGNLCEEAQNVITNIANQKHSTIYSSSEPSNVLIGNDGITFSYRIYSNNKLNSNAYYSVIDACLALEAIYILKDQFIINDEAIKKGLLSVLPCRFERLSKHILLDGSHNPEGTKVFYDSFSKFNQNIPAHVIFACFKDKNISLMLPTIGLIDRNLVLTTFPHSRARKKEDYFLYLDDYKYYDDWKDAYNTLRKEYPNDLIVFTGSLAFVAFIRCKFKNGEISDE